MWSQSNNWKRPYWRRCLSTSLSWRGRLCKMCKTLIQLRLQMLPLQQILYLSSIGYHLLKCLLTYVMYLRDCKACFHWHIYLRECATFYMDVYSVLIVNEVIQSMNSSVRTKLREKDEFSWIDVYTKSVTFSLLFTVIHHHFGFKV